MNKNTKKQKKNKQKNNKQTKQQKPTKQKNNKKQKIKNKQILIRIKNKESTYAPARSSSSRFIS